MMTTKEQQIEELTKTLDRIAPRITELEERVKESGSVKDFPKFSDEMKTLFQEEVGKLSYGTLVAVTAEFMMKEFCEAKKRRLTTMLDSMLKGQL